MAIFKRRTKKTWGEATGEVFYPRGGWARAFEYVKHRMRRLPGSPESIGRGIGVGVFVTFTPFFGLHFAISALVAMAVRGNVLASLLATFFGNPITFPIIAIMNMRLGYWILQTPPGNRSGRSIGRKFADAGRDLWHNFKSIFTSDHADWGRWNSFVSDVLLPYLIGGIVPGLIVAGAAYFLSVPLIRAYQKRRKSRLTRP